MQASVRETKTQEQVEGVRMQQPVGGVMTWRMVLQDPQGQRGHDAIRCYPELEEQNRCSCNRWTTHKPTPLTSLIVVKAGS